MDLIIKSARELVGKAVDGELAELLSHNSDLLVVAQT